MHQRRTNETDRLQQRTTTRAILRRNSDAIMRSTSLLPLLGTQTVACAPLHVSGFPITLHSSLFIASTRSSLHLHPTSVVSLWPCFQVFELVVHSPDSQFTFGTRGSGVRTQKGPESRPKVDLSPRIMILLRSALLWATLCPLSWAWAPRIPDSGRRHRLHAAGADIEQPPVDAAASPQNVRAKVNEIDFCIAPADVSMSRKSSSLTAALNNASNRAVRRILLSRSWPSAEALNLSVRS